MKYTPLLPDIVVACASTSLRSDRWASLLCSCSCSQLARSFVNCAGGRLCPQPYCHVRTCESPGISHEIFGSKNIIYFFTEVVRPPLRVKFRKDKYGDQHPIRLDNNTYLKPPSRLFFFKFLSHWMDWGVQSFKQPHFLQGLEEKNVETQPYSLRKING